MFIGLLISGSAAKSWIWKPSGSWKVFDSASGVNGSLERTYSVKGSAARPTAMTPAKIRMINANERHVAVNMRIFMAETGSLGKEVRHLRGALASR